MNILELGSLKCSSQSNAKDNPYNLSNKEAISQITLGYTEYLMHFNSLNRLQFIIITSVLILLPRYQIADAVMFHILHYYLIIIFVCYKAQLQVKSGT